MLGIFLDTETNGLNPLKHSLLEIAIKIVDVMSGKRLATFSAIISQPKEVWAASDPISLQVNGFKWEEIQKGEHPGDVAKKIIALFKQHGVKRGKAVFICQNPSFDRAFFSQLIDPDIMEELGWPYHWLDLASMYWVKGIEVGRENHARFPWVTGVSKDKIATAVSLPPEGQPHRAMTGVDHLLLCYEKIVGFPAVVESSVE